MAVHELRSEGTFDPVWNEQRRLDIDFTAALVDVVQRFIPDETDRRELLAGIKELPTYGSHSPGVNIEIKM